MDTKVLNARRKIIVDFHIALLRVIGYCIRSIGVSRHRARKWNLRKSLTQTLNPPLNFISLGVEIIFFGTRERDS